MTTKTKNRFRVATSVAAVLFSIALSAAAQIGTELQMAELSKKLQLTDQQTKELTPIVEQRDKQIKALTADTSMGKLQKLRKASEIQTNFRDQAAKHLNTQQIKALDALQAERRAKLKRALTSGE
jgi:predicted transcriptional regulator